MIEWESEPEFMVLHDGFYNRFQCVKSGVVLLDGKAVGFPPGWVTDFTTGNWLTFIFLPQLGAHVPAALLHDRLLDLGYPRKDARKWMREQLDLLENVHLIRRFVMPLGVRIYDFLKYLK